MNLLESSPAAAVRCGKIARLPISLREQVNRRLENNEPASTLLDWLNRLPETKQILASQFNGAPISPQNLSDWRQGGFREWLLRRELTQQAESLNESAAAIQGQRPPQALVDNLALVLAARYAALLNTWDGSSTPEFEAQLRILRAFNHDIVQLQKSLLRSVEQNLKLESEKEAKGEADLEKERKRKILPLVVMNDVASLTNVYGEDRGRIKAAIQNKVTLEEVALFCGPPSSRVVPNQGAPVNASVPVEKAAVG